MPFILCTLHVTKLNKYSVLKSHLFLNSVTAPNGPRPPPSLLSFLDHIQLETHTYTPPQTHTTHTHTHTARTHTHTPQTHTKNTHTTNTHTHTTNTHQKHSHHKDTHTHTHTIGILWTIEQLVAQATTNTTQQTNIHALSAIRTRDLSNQAAVDL